MQKFTCDCGHILFFATTQCPRCQREVGYEPESSTLLLVGATTGMRRCENGLLHGVCNWLIPIQSAERLCVSCRLNRTIPDLSLERNLMLWSRMETAKRRLLYTLLRLGIRLPSKAEDPKEGLAFDMVSTVLNPEVTTGHLNGVITVNLEEADDTYRQINQQQLGESNRTLVGHFRHESAHYFWQRFLSEADWAAPLRVAFRERFGNEWLDYAAALSSHYAFGAPPEWDQKFITAYAASHPWEDWAETWAHYLQIVDGMETCETLGIQAQYLAVPLEILPGEAGFLPVVLPQNPAADDAFLSWLQRWQCMATVLNEVSGSLGEPALYPYGISVHVAQKLRLAHHFAGEWARTN
ncbi:MAG: putative zinc-binding metallopeptidase [Verrucomicrobium sp.]